MTTMTKRTVTMSVKIATDDAELLEKAAATFWPGAPITKGNAALALAAIGAESVLHPRKKKKT